MNQKTYLSIGEFSRLTGIARANLRFYDEIGLLKPEARGENHYRCYTRRQLNSAYLISSLREVGIGLEEIRRYADGRTPQRMLALFHQQDNRIQQELDKLLRIRAQMRTYVAMAQEALAWVGRGVHVEERGEEPLFLGPVLTPEQLDEEAGIAFYDLAAEKGVDLGNLLGAIIDRQNFDAGDAVHAARYYFRTQQEKNAVKPAGRYAVAYARCMPRESGFLYRQLQEYTAANGLQMCGDAYEECPIDEISVQDASDFCVKVEILVADA